MKHIGQNVFELPTSFRNDIFGLCDTFRLTCDDIRFYSESLKDPLFQIRNERNDANGPRLRLTKVRTSGFQPLLSEITTDATALAGQDDDVCGTFEFMSSDSNADTQIYAQIQGTIHDATIGQESGKLALGVASHDGGVENGLVLTGGSVDTEVDVTLGNGTSSVTTIAGSLRPKGQVQAVYSSFSANDLGTKHYLAFNDGDSENTDHANVDMPIVAPVAGKLLSVSMRQTRDESDETYTIRLETQATGVAHSTGPSVVGTQSGTAPTNTSLVRYDFTSGLDSGDNVIDAGDYVYISIQSTANPPGSTKYFFTCLFEWDYSSI